MSVPIQNPSITYAANGASTNYPYNFKIVDASHLKVRLNGVLLVSGFSVDGVNSETGGAVIFQTAPIQGSVLKFSRELPVKRDTAYSDTYPFRAATLNRDFDDTVMMIQDLGAKLNDISITVSGPVTGAIDATNGQIKNFLADVANIGGLTTNTISWTTATGPINVANQIPNASIGIDKLKAEQLPGGTPSGTTLPPLANEGNTFFKSDTSVLYIYRGGSWREVITDLNLQAQLTDLVGPNQLTNDLEARVNLIDAANGVANSVNTRIAAVTASNTSAFATFSAQLSVANNNIIDLQNSFSVDSVTVSATSATKASSTPTIAAYNTWYEFASYTWTPAQGDHLAGAFSVPFVMSAVTATGTDRLAVQVRARLRDMTLGADVPGGTSVWQPYDRIGAQDYSGLAQSFSQAVFYDTNRPGLTVPTHQYKVFFEIQKAQLANTPTGTLTLGTPRIDNAVVSLITA